MSSIVIKDILDLDIDNFQYEDAILIKKNPSYLNYDFEIVPFKYNGKNCEIIFDNMKILFLNKKSTSYELCCYVGDFEREKKIIKLIENIEDNMINNAFDKIWVYDRMKYHENEVRASVSTEVLEQKVICSFYKYQRCGHSREYYEKTYSMELIDGDQLLYPDCYKFILNVSSLNTIKLFDKNYNKIDSNNIIQYLNKGTNVKITTKPKIILEMHITFILEISEIQLLD